MGGVAAASRRPALALPVGQVGRSLLGHAFPPDVAIVGQGDIREDGVGPDRLHRIWIRIVGGARGDAEETGLGIDGVQAAVGAGLQPGDVVAERGDLPALEMGRRDQHREIRLAAGAGEGGRDIGRIALRILHLEDKHMLGHPAFIAGHAGGDSQRVALLAQQRVAAVTAAERPDRPFLGEVHDVLRGVAGPWHVVLAGPQRLADGVQAGHKVAVLAEDFPDCRAHARHDAHIRHNVGRVGELDANLRKRRTERAHAERDDIQNATVHGAKKKAVQGGLHLARRHPIVRGAGIGLALAADECAVLDAGDVGRVGTHVDASGTFRRIEADGGAVLHHQFDHAVVFDLGTVAPLDRRWLAESGYLIHPRDHAGVAGRKRRRLTGGWGGGLKRSLHARRGRYLDC